MTSRGISSARRAGQERIASMSVAAYNRNRVFIDRKRLRRREDSINVSSSLQQKQGRYRQEETEKKRG